jgi:hypothetical protein
MNLTYAFGDTAPASQLAAQPSTASGAELAAQVQQMDPNVVKDAGIQQAEQVRQLPAQMRAQGIPVSAADEAKANQLADHLASKANEPDFQDKIVDALKKVDNAVIRAGIESLKGIGYAGTAIFSVGVIPFMFGSDFVSAVILGRGPFTDGSKNNWDEFVGTIGGVTAFYYTFLGLQLASVILPGTIMAGSMGIVVGNILFCAHKEKHGNGEIDQYCKENRKILHVITSQSAKCGDYLGKEVHKGLVEALHFVEKPFRKEKPEASPSPEPSASPSPEPSPSNQVDKGPCDWFKN